MTNSLWVAEDFVPERGQPCWSNPGLQEVSPVGIELLIQLNLYQKMVVETSIF